MNSKKMLIAGVAILALGSIGTVKSSDVQETEWESVYFEDEEDQGALVKAVVNLENLQVTPKSITYKKRTKGLIDYGVPVLAGGLIANGAKKGSWPQIISGTVIGALSGLYHFVPTQVRRYNTKITRKSWNKNLKVSIEKYNFEKATTKINLANLLENLVGKPEEQINEVNLVNVAEQTMLLKLLLDRTVVNSFKGEKDGEGQDFKGFFTELSQKVALVNTKLLEKMGEQEHVDGYLNSFEHGQKQFIHNVLNPQNLKEEEEEEEEEGGEKEKTKEEKEEEGEEGEGEEIKD